VPSLILIFSSSPILSLFKKPIYCAPFGVNHDLLILTNLAPETKISVLRILIRQQATPIIEATPPRSTMESSGTLIPETPKRSEQSNRHELNNALPNNTIQLLILLG